MNKSNEQITTLLEDLGAGVFAQKINAAFADAALGVVTTGKKGSITISFELKRIGESNQVACTHAIKYSRPTGKGKISEENSDMTPLHVGVGGKLTLFPETQQPLFGENQQGSGSRIPT